MPSGWPRAIAPPLTLTLSGSRPSSSMHASDCDANASLSSIRSRSSTPIPHARAPCAWRARGRCPSRPGRRRRSAVATTRASGRRPSARARSASTRRTADAPSLMPELLPAVTVPPSGLKAGLQARQRLDRGVGARVLVAIDDERLALPLRHRDRDELVGEAAGLDGGDGAPLALERERVLALAGTPQRSATFSAVSPIEYG